MHHAHVAEDGQGVAYVALSHGIRDDNQLGGIGVGYSAGYSWQTVFNTFGALSIASGLFGMPYAVALRIGANLFGSVYTVLCNKLFDKAHAYFHSTDLKTTLS